MDSIPEAPLEPVVVPVHAQEEENEVRSPVNGHHIKQSDSVLHHVPIQERAHKKMKKGIFISYSPDAGFLERAFLSDLVQQLKENNLADDIWFDRDENCIDNPTWFSQRMEAAERCQAAVLILSDQYLMCPVSVYESRVLIERQIADPASVRIFSILYSMLTDTHIPQNFHHHLSDMVDLTVPSCCKLSIAEKTSVVMGKLMEKLEKFAVINSPLSISKEVEPEFDGKYKSRKLCRWSASELQEWLYNLGIKEYYRQILAERMLDGFLLLSVTDSDLVEELGIDSRVVRKKIIQQVISLLDKEHRLADNWHLRCRSVRSKANTVYLIYDPADVRLAQTFKQDLIKKGLQVINHQKLGQSKEEFLKINGPALATASSAILILTDHSSRSPFVFHETLFADWLGKKVIAAVFKNDWVNLRPAMKAVTGGCLAVDFETRMYQEGMDILDHHLKPMHSLPGVVLEQSYLTKMNEGLKPLASFATVTNTDLPLRLPSGNSRVDDPLLFISFQWDMQTKIEEIQKVLEAHGFTCWSDVGAHMRGHSSLSSRSASTNLRGHIDTHDNLKSNLQQNMKKASLVICCITPKYLQSDNCIHDLRLAESLNKPILALLLRFVTWPPDATLPSVRRTLAKCGEIVELYNDKLFRQNLHLVVDKVRKNVPSCN